MTLRLEGNFGTRLIADPIGPNDRFQISAGTDGHAQGYVVLDGNQILELWEFVKRTREHEQHFFHDVVRLHTIRPREPSTFLGGFEDESDIGALLIAQSAFA